MVEIEATTDAVRLSFLRAILDAAAIQSFVFEANIGALWPGAFATRLMVAPRDEAQALAAIRAADPKAVWR